MPSAPRVTATRDVMLRRRAWSATQSLLLELSVGGAALDDALVEIGRALDECMAGAHSAILLLTEGGASLRVACAPRLPAGYTAWLAPMRLGAGCGAYGAAAFWQEPVVVSDIQASPQWADWSAVPIGWGYRACWSIPVVGPGGRVVAAIDLYVREPRAPSAWESRVLADAARLVAVAIQWRDRGRGTRSDAAAGGAEPGSTGERAPAEREAVRVAGGVEPQRVERLEAVGQLAGGIAHDFNNLLTTILAGCDLALAELEPTHPVREFVGDARIAGERAAQLTRQLLAFSRQQVVQLCTLDPNEVLQTASPMLRRLVGDGVRLELLPGSGIGTVRADRAQLEQVLTNLVTNARDAMPDGGTITISTQHVPPDQAPAPLHGIFAAITVADTGTGMDDATRGHLFEPFFTTKEVGKGSGLGLATVYGIVEQAGGSILVESAPGMGTTVQILLPASRERAPTPPHGIRVPDVTMHGHETILLVEDEDGVRALLKRTLEKHGYVVLEAENGADALRVQAQHGGPLDLLITDVVMPVMGGPEAASRLRARQADLPVLFVSGYAEEAVRVDGLLLPESHFLGKPFAPQKLLTTVRAIFDAPVAAG